MKGIHDWVPAATDKKTGFTVERCTKCGATQSTGNPNNSACPK